MSALFSLTPSTCASAACRRCRLHLRIARRRKAGAGRRQRQRQEHAAANVLHGLVPPAAGSLQRRRGRQAMLFQRPYMLRASVLHNVALGLWLGGVRWREAKAQALAALARVGLEHLATRNAKALSGGQQQRVALARAWALQAAGAAARRAHGQPRPALPSARSNASWPSSPMPA
jgi:energy-coupling factor transporter ATP-binding protein EcfA2